MISIVTLQRLAAALASDWKIPTQHSGSVIRLKKSPASAGLFRGQPLADSSQPWPGIIGSLYGVVKPKACPGFKGLVPQLVSMSA